MAAATTHETPVSDEIVRDRARNWEAFTQFVKIGTGAVIVLLVLMAIFLV